MTDNVRLPFSMLLPREAKSVPLSEIAWLLATAKTPEQKSESDELRRHAALINEEDALKDALIEGRVMARNPLTWDAMLYATRPDTPGGLIVAREDFERYAATRFVSVSGGEIVEGMPVGNKPGRKPGTHKQDLDKILCALEEWAASEGRTFNRHKMPGPLGSADDEGSFHWLCARLYSGQFQKSTRAFEEHRAGVCAFGAWPEPSEIYRLALPHIAQKLGIQLKPQNRRKAL